MLDRGNIPFMLVNLLTWHGIKIMHYQNKQFFQVNLSKTPRAWYEMHSCTLWKQFSIQEEELKGYHVIVLWPCRHANETSDVHYKSHKMPIFLGHTPQCVPIERITLRYQILGHTVSCNSRVQGQNYHALTRTPVCHLLETLSRQSAGTDHVDQKLSRVLKKSRYLISINHVWFKPNVQVHLLALAINLFIVIRAYRLLPKKSQNK